MSEKIRWAIEDVLEDLRWRMITHAVRLCPWWLLERLTTRYRLCWADVVMIKMGYTEYNGSLRPSPMCWSGLIGKEYDYCGRFKTEAEFKAASEGK